MKKRAKKLVLAKETVRNLMTGILGNGPTGGGSDFVVSSCGQYLCLNQCPNPEPPPPPSDLTCP